MAGNRLADLKEDVVRTYVFDKIAERKEKQCEHPIDDWEHDYDPDSILGDAYYCGHCGKLMQVG